MIREQQEEAANLMELRKVRKMGERCYLFENGECNKDRRKKKCCGGMQTDWFNDEFARTNDPMKACERTSIFGNYYFKLTDEDIDALKRGEILYYVDEYGTFIRYEGSINNADND